LTITGKCVGSNVTASRSGAETRPFAGAYVLPHKQASTPMQKPLTQNTSDEQAANESADLLGREA